MEANTSGTECCAFLRIDLEIDEDVIVFALCIIPVMLDPWGGLISSTRLDWDSCEPPEESLFELANKNGTAVQEFTVDVTEDVTNREFGLV